MNGIHYLLEANLYLVAFYLLYVFLLRSETLYLFNRVYLLITSLLAFAIPVIQLGILKPEVLQSAGVVGSVSLDMEPAAINVVSQTLVEAPKWTMTDYALTAYAVITVALLFHLIFKVSKLLSLSKKGNAKPGDGFVLIELPGENVAFSFFGYLFVNHELSASQTILHHEQVHIRQKHSWDVIYFELLKVFNWFNPVIYLIEKSVKEVHEFIADQQVAIAENGAEDYADFLISNAYGISNNQLTNSFFNKNLLKRRIIMLYQKKSGKAARLKYLLTLPLVGSLLCASTLAFTTKDYGLVDISPKAKNIIANPSDSVNAAPKADDQSEYAKGWRQAEQDMKNGKIQTPNAIKFPAPKTVIIKGIAGDPVFNSVEQNPTFPGHEEGFGKFLRDNIRYPKEAKDKNVTGRVFIQFIVGKDGSLSEFKVLRDPGSGLGEEALRVMKLSPKWKPGSQKGEKVRVMYTVPVNFQLANDDKKAVKRPSGEDTVYKAVNVTPKFPGGEEAFGKFLRDHIRYPKEAKENNVTGRTFIQFIVEKDGSLSNLKLLRDPGAGLGEESVRVLALSPKWIPGTKNGEIVRVEYTVPVNYSLAEDYMKKDIGTLYYVMAKIRYPQEALAKNVHGREFVQFTLSADKQIQDIKILRSADKSFDMEVTRALQAFKVITDGKPGVTYVMPVNFSIDDVKNQRTFNPANYKASPKDFEPNEKNQITLSESIVFGYK